MDWFINSVAEVMTSTLHFLSFVSQGINCVQKVTITAPRATATRATHMKWLKWSYGKLRSNLGKWYSEGLSCVFAYVVYASVDWSAWKHTSKHKHAGLWGVMECFKDTGSVKKDRKRLWMAAPNKIDRTLKIYKHTASTFFLFLTPLQS